jgi:predicted acyl esterase
VTSAGGDPTVARAFDPIAGDGACATTTAVDEPGTASYRLPPSDGYTLLGAPTITADLQLTGAFPILATRLLDVAPDGTQTLVARGLYRPTGDGPQSFQLHPGAWRFAPGHVARVEVLGRDAPYARASNGTFTVDVRSLEVRLPVR